jgi:PPOX class probable F420-dependent enzyme
MGKLAKCLLAIDCRFHDWVRHPYAGAVTVSTSSLNDFHSLYGHSYCLLITSRNSGATVPTPVWFGLITDDRLFINTGKDALKVKRIQKYPQVCVAPCTWRGRPLGPAACGTARIVCAEEVAMAETAIRQNYGLGRRLFQRAVGTRVDSVYIEISPGKTH